MPITRAIGEGALAQQMASLINKHNHLAVARTAEDILNSETIYTVELYGKVVVGLCGVHRQAHAISEIKHLVVHPQYRGKGIGAFLVKSSLSKVKTPVCYASVRSENQGSLRVFERLGFKKALSYQTGKNEVCLMIRGNELWNQKKSSMSQSAPEENILPLWDPFPLPS